MSGTTKLTFPEGCRFIVCLLDGFDGNALCPIEDKPLGDLCLKLAKFPTRYVYITNGDENHLAGAKKALHRHLKSDSYTLLRTENCLTFCDAMSDLNYSSKLYANFEGHIILYLTTPVLKKLTEATALCSLMDVVETSLQHHLDCVATTTPLMSLMFNPDDNSDTYLLTDDTSGDILQWGEKEHDGKIEIDEVMRTKSKVFTVSQGVSFSNVMLSNDNKSLSEIINDSTSSMRGFAKNTIDSGIMRPFQLLRVDVPHSLVLRSEDPSYEKPELPLDPFYSMIDATDESQEDVAFKNEISAFVIDGLNRPESLKFKLMEVKTYRLAANKSDYDVLGSALSTLFSCVRVQGSTVPVPSEDVSVELSSKSFESWFSKHNLSLLWDMFFTEEDSQSIDVVLTEAYLWAKNQLYNGATIENVFGRLLKCLSDTTDECCSNSLDLSTVERFIQSREVPQEDEVTHKRIVENREFCAFLEWTKMEEEDDYEEYDDDSD